MIEEQEGKKMRKREVGIIEGLGLGWIPNSFGLAKICQT